MDKVRAFLRLTRIEHSIMLVIAVIAAELISGHVAGSEYRSSRAWSRRYWSAWARSR